MADEKKVRKIDVPGGFNVNNLGAALTIMQTSFRTTVEKMAEEHGNTEGDWLDELQEVLVRDAKGTVAEGISIEADAAGVKLGIDVLEATLDAVRSNLTTKE